MSFEPRETHETHEETRERSAREGRQYVKFIGGFLIAIAAIGLVIWAVVFLTRGEATIEPSAFVTPEAAPPREQLDLLQTLTARNNQFDRNLLTARTGDNLILQLNNEDEGVLHNFALYRDRNFTEQVFQGEPSTGPERVEYQIEMPVEQAGTFFFRCDFHPETMFGELVVR
jgi:plastocyanin